MIYEAFALDGMGFFSNSFLSFLSTVHFKHCVKFTRLIEYFIDQYFQCMDKFMDPSFIPFQMYIQRIVICLLIKNTLNYFVENP